MSLSRPTTLAIFLILSSSISILFLSTPSPSTSNSTHPLSLLPSLRTLRTSHQRISTPESCTTAHDIQSNYSRTLIQRSVAHSGTAARLTSVLERARRGERLNVGVLGGSVSTGHGALDGQRFVYGAVKEEERWYSYVQRYLDSLLPSSPSTPPSTGHNYTLGAKPAVSSSYYSWCFGHHIPARDVDLVLLELAINDQFIVSDAKEFERLLRGILTLEKAPAVLVVATMAQVGRSKYEGMSQGGDAQLPIVGYYDVPMISLRNALSSHMESHPLLSDPYYSIDPRHIRPILHGALGQLVVHYMASRLCEVDRERLEGEDTGRGVEGVKWGKDDEELKGFGTEWTGEGRRMPEWWRLLHSGNGGEDEREEEEDDEAEAVADEFADERRALHSTSTESDEGIPLYTPPASALVRNPTPIPLWPPLSSSFLVPALPLFSSLPNPLSPSLTTLPPPSTDGIIPSCLVAGDNLSPLPPSDWHMFDWKDTKHYYEALEPGQSIRMGIEVQGQGGTGRIALAYLRSWEYRLGKARCTAIREGEENKSSAGAGVVLDGYWTTHASVSDTAIIASDLQPGKYIVTCTTLSAAQSSDPSKGTGFRIVSLMAE